MGAIRIDILGVDASEGLIIGGIYLEDDFKRFGGGDPICRTEAPAHTGALTLVFPDVPSGRYAAAVYHDRNANRSLDLNFVGVPAEGRGYSQVDRAGLAAPTFEAAAFDHDGETQLSITLRYPGT